MRKLLLIVLSILSIRYGHCQEAKHFTRNVADIKGAIVKQEQGEFRNQSGQVEGSYKIVYIIDTIQKQLLNVSITTKDRRGEVIYLYYYNQNRLSKASSGVVQNGYTEIQNTYDYDSDDFAIKEKDLNAFSQTEEKYALLKESWKYLAVLKKL
jgi:hypothetical protein